jgi:ribosome-binding factor A
MASVRQEKVAKLIQQDLAVIFSENARELFGGAFITVTIVRMTPDLGMAKVYLSFFANSGTDKEELLAMVKTKTSAVRGILGRKIGKQVRIVPELAFYLDDSLDYASEIDNLLKK